MRETGWAVLGDELVDGIVEVVDQMPVPPIRPARLERPCKCRVPAGQGLSGSGLAIANAPEPVISEVAELLPWLAALLDQGDAGWSLWAVPAERG